MSPAVAWEATWKSPSVPSVRETKPWWGCLTPQEHFLPWMLPWGSCGPQSGYRSSHPFICPLCPFSVVHPPYTKGKAGEAKSGGLGCDLPMTLTLVSSLVSPGRSEAALWDWWHPSSDLQINSGLDECSLLTVLHLLRRRPSSQLVGWWGGSSLEVSYTVAPWILMGLPCSTLIWT